MLQHMLHKSRGKPLLAMRFLVGRVPRRPEQSLFCCVAPYSLERGDSRARGGKMMFWRPEEMHDPLPDAGVGQGVVHLFRSPEHHFAASGTRIAPLQAIWCNAAK